ncbi:MAG: hypothetical protein JO023_07325 [Chloroflexi bacterium]|nr:hypothetical protein [Chloroflexota bacterium]
MSTPVPAESSAVVRDTDVDDGPERRAAYRRLTAAILGLDVNTLALELRAKRLGIAADGLPLAA